MNEQEHHYPSGGSHYSGSNRIPNIKQFVASLDKDKKARDAKIDAAEENQQPQQNDSLPQGAREHISSHNDGKNRRTVRDPTTGKDVEIVDITSKHVKSTKDPMLTVPNPSLQLPSTISTSPDQPDSTYRHNQDVTAPPDPIAPGSTSDVPIHGEATNVLFHPTPSISFEPMFASIEARANVLAAAIFFGIIIIGYTLSGGSLLTLIPLAAVISSGVFLWTKDLISQGRKMEWHSERKRGEFARVNLIPESVEWLNTAISLVWGLINPDMFAGVADTLEDVMQASLPGVIENVKVNDFTLGKGEALRVLSLRALPDGEVKQLKDGVRKEMEKDRDEQELKAEEEGGEFYNLEATVAYHSLPTEKGNVSARAEKNIGMQLVFYLGIKGLFGVPLPIWVELERMVATVRLRFSLAPDPPFVKTLSFTLMGLPKVEASCVPIVEKGANILNLPVISNFVNWAIATAASMYVAPKSMTLDIGKMLQGDDVKKETNALGVLFIRIHKAVGLSKQDRRGSKGGGSDPYICVAFSKFGKPQYCTRVIQDDLNPVFEESCALLVTADVVKADEQLSLELWDSDRSSADDVVGKVELSIQKLIQHPGRMFPQISKLKGVKAGSSMPGELHWEVGFFGKTQFRKALRTDGKDLSLPPGLRDKKELQDDKGALETEVENAVVCTPPDPLWPSGVLSVVVHQIVGLELENVKGSNGKRKGREYEPARPDAGEIKEEAGKKLPSAYCTILVNDELVYKTRTKVVSSKPIFEAGTERFIRDWRSAIVTVSVRDSRNREHDPIIGVVPLKLSDVLQSASQSTRWYPLDGGIGFGRIRISLLFRSVELKLPPAQVGFGEIGTFEFLGDQIRTVSYAPGEKTFLKLRTGGSSGSVKGQFCQRSQDGNGLAWDISGEGKSQKLRLPVRYRYRSPVFFEFHPPGKKRKTDIFAAVWLQDVPDMEENDYDIPIWRCDNGLRLSQNYITEGNYTSVPDIKIEEVGRLRFRGRFKPGTDRDHLKFVSDNESRETIESWEACFAEGVRAEHVKAEVPPVVQKLHEESLTHGRDVLRTASEEDKKMWLSRDGRDWTGAFGKDPNELLANHRGESGSGSSASASVEDQDEDSSDDDDEVDLGIADAEHGELDAEKKKKEKKGKDEDEGNGNYTWERNSEESSGAAGRASVDTRDTMDMTISQATQASTNSKNPIKVYKDYRSRSRDLHRQHRGLMQWKPMRNIAFAKDETLFAARRVMKVGSLSGRKPDVETEV
ncbi:hypothetical protein QBC38DRAFT_153165 [Podospora fimiseda]|uniref:Meiotically up-regulated gene 190 protein n=1 Tax=Podospora fimiseda TaxID=252190 RepID=A0AAN7BS44_9PEZI|nr:hypothetical protein QBC38DRAFT_153165 [Podospora fimiseda]